jgi:hypothetical protein
VYRVPGAFPRAWTVHSARRIADRNQILDDFDVSREQLASATFMTGSAPALDRCASQDSVAIEHATATEFSLRADMACRGMVIVANTYFPGWRAEVDGKAAPVSEAYTFLTGIVVDAGRHQVRLWYRPVSLIAGYAMAAIALAGLWGLAWIDRPFRQPLVVKWLHP